MTRYIIASDNNFGQEKSILNQVQKLLKQEGHTVKNVGVGNTVLQNYCLTKASKGGIAVFLLSGVDGWTFSDFHVGMTRGYYHCKEAYFFLESWFVKKGDHRTCEGLKKYKMVRPHDARAGLENMYKGKTVAQFMKQYPDCKIYCANSPKDIVDKLLNRNTQNNKKKTEYVKTFKEMLKDLLGLVDGDIQCYFKGDTAYINKIPSNYTKVPKNQSKITLIDEGVNVKYDSVNIQDFNPSTPNSLIVSYTEKGKTKYFTLRNQYLIDRFGKEHVELNAVKYEPVNLEKPVDSYNEDKDKTEADKKREENLREQTTIKSNFIQKPITTYKGAKNFALREWNKLQRDNEHLITIQVWGSNDYHVGQLCYIILPMVAEVSPMFISKVSHNVDANSAWITQLELTPHLPAISTTDWEEELTLTGDKLAEIRSAKESREEQEQKSKKKKKKKGKGKKTDAEKSQADNKHDVKSRAELKKIIDKTMREHGQ